MLGARQVNRFLRTLLAIASGIGVAYAAMDFGGMWLSTAVLVMVLALLLWAG
jgi:fatty acid desaturase